MGVAVVVLLVILVLAFYERSEQPVDVSGLPLVDPNVEIVTTASGLQYQDLVVGDGETASAGMEVEVHYTGMLTDGTQFDSSVDRGPFSFQLGMGSVIKGWDEGVAGMRVGGKRVLIIPPELGYGAAGAGASIPPNATLIFEVELLAIK